MPALSRPQKNVPSLHKILPKSCSQFKSKPAPMVIPSGLLVGSKRENIERCLELLDHFTECRQRSECTEGEGCRRTKQVLYHFMNCSNQRNCSICEQLTSLCSLHGQRCQKGPEECDVPLCHNGRTFQNILNQRGEFHEEASIEDCKEVMKSLELALKKTSVSEKREKILKLLKKHPAAASKVLRDIYQLKLNKTRQRQTQAMAGAPEKALNDSMESGVPHSRPVPNLYVAHFKIMKADAMS